MPTINGYRQSVLTQASVRSMQDEMARLQRQLDTDRKYDNFGEYGGRASREIISLRGDINRTDAYDATIHTLDGRAGAANEAMQAIAKISQDVRNDAYQLRVHDPVQPAGLRDVAGAAFEDVVRQLNTQVNGHHVFAGSKATTPPVKPAADILTSVKTAIDDAINAALTAVPPTTLTFDDLMAAADSVFDDTTSPWADPGVEQAAVRISDLKEVTSKTRIDPHNPNDPFRSLAQKLAVLAVVDPRDENLQRVLAYSSPMTSPDPAVPVSEDHVVAARQLYITFAEQTGDALTRAVDGTTTLRGLKNVIAENGQYRAALDAQIEAHATLRLHAGTALGKVEGIDAYEAVTRIQNLQTNLETSYRVTSELRRLTLANFL
jgi:flagellar hook-associated protein 3 FlgL